MRYNHSDPTANQAIANVDREIRREARRREAEGKKRAAVPRRAAGSQAAKAPAGNGWRLAWTDKRGSLNPVAGA